MNWTQKQILETGELLHQTDTSLRDISSVVGIPVSKLLSDFSVTGRSPLDVLLVVVCNELLTVKIGSGCEYHSFGLGLKLVHKIIHHTDLSSKEISKIRAAYSGALSTAGTGLEKRCDSAISAWLYVIRTICGSVTSDEDKAERTENFLTCVREVTYVGAHSK